MIGKLSSDDLRRIIFDNIRHRRSEVLVRPEIGEDCAVVDFGEYVLVITTDPITGTASEVGKLAININCNDIASNGVEPLGIMITILAPVGTTVDELDYIMNQAGSEAEKLNIEIIGGHTEITDAVNRVVISATAIGKQNKKDMVTTSGAVENDLVIMTKTAGMEGTGIIAFEKEKELGGTLTPDEIAFAKGLLDKTSVIKEGIIGGRIKVSSMHDITEGGVLGAVWELCEAAKKGCIVDYDKIPINEVTQNMQFYKIDPLKLISSGSMLITCSPDKSKELLNSFNDEGIEYSIIGKITKSDKIIIKDNSSISIESPQSDELYKVV